VALDAESAARRALEHQLADLDRDLRARLAQADARIVALTADLDQARSTRARVAESPLVGRALTTRDGRLVECNDTFATFFGYADADDMVSRQTNTPLQGLGQVVIDTRGGGRAANRLHDLTITRVDGQTVRLRESHAAVTAPDGRELVEHIVVDASATLRLEEQLRQARRLEEVGSLAASMAPDIESRLLAVADAGSRLRDAVPGSDPRRVSADAVLTNLDDAVVLVRQLWSFSQRQVRPLEATDLNDAVRRAEPTLRRLVGPHVQFRMDLRDSSVITHDEGDLDQLVTALVMAARELLPVGGSVVVETDRVELDAGDLGQLPDGRPGANTVIAVSATGYGALRAQPSQSAEVLARRCGGVLRVTNRGDRTVAFEAYFPDAAARSQK
jgi:signal transduction histidine kinase